MNNNAWRILLVDDDEEDYFLTREMLSSMRRGKYTLDWCSSFERGLASLQTGAYDAALVDYDLGLHTGIEFMRLAIESGCTTPMLMVTGRGSYEVDVEAMQAGAQDYLSKGDLNPALLERAIRYAIERKSSETALANANLELQQANQSLKEARLSAEQAAIEAKQAAREARASALRVETIINNLTDVILVFDKDDRVVLANAFAVAMLGFDPIRLTRSALFQRLMVAGEDGQPITFPNMPASRAHSGEVILNYPLAIKNTRGREYHILASSMPLYVGHEYMGVASVWNDVTETWQASRTLRKNEAELKAQKRALENINQQLQGLFDHAPVGMVLYDAEPPYKVLVHNRIFQEFWPEPFHSQGMTGKYITDFAPLAEESGILEVYREVARTGEGRTLYNTPYDGMPRGRTWWNWTVSPVFVEGKLTAFAHMLIEVTQEVLARQGLEQELEERTRAEQMLEAERSRLEGILQSLPLAIWVSDAQGRIVLTNHEADVIWHGSAPLSENIEAYREYKARWPETGASLRPDDWPLAIALREGRRVGSLEIEIERFDGTTGSVLVSGAPFYNSAGELLGAVAIDQDITDRKQLEMALRESERVRREANDRFRVALENLPIAVFTMDTDLRYTWVYNPQPYLPAEQMTGKRDEDLLDAEDARVLTALKQAVIASGERVSQEFTLHVNNEPRQYLFTAEPLRAADGAITGLIGTNMDITEQRRMEAKQIEFRTQMEVQHHLLEHRESERQEIARDIHDGPIQSIVSTMFNIQTARDSAPDEETKRTLDAVAAALRGAVQELRGMVNALRPPVLIRFGLSRAIQIHAEDIHARYPDLKMDLDLIEDENLLPEETCLALYRVYQEAINNIIRHASARCVWVRYYPTGPNVVLDIRDDGAGFTPPTNWLDFTRGHHFGMVGMRERVETLGGSLAILSAPGQGTELKISVPMKK